MFRLMFRLYRVPKRPPAYLTTQDNDSRRKAFYESRKLLGVFAATARDVKSRNDGAKTGKTHFLVLSAITAHTINGACAALRDRRCGIYDRRPDACRSVPFHYSRPSALAARELAEFVSRAGYQCDTGPDADIVIDQGAIVTPAILEARNAAKAKYQADRKWASAIVKRMGRTEPGAFNLPTLREIEESATIGTLAATMQTAWRIALIEGLMDEKSFRQVLANQLAVIDRCLAPGANPPADADDLRKIAAEYRHALQNAP